MLKDEQKPKLKLKEVAQLDPGAILEAMREFQTECGDELVKMKQSIELTYETMVTELKELHSTQHKELKETINNTTIESTALEKALLELQRDADLIKFLEEKNSISKDLNDQLRFNEFNQAQIIVGIIRNKSDKSNELVEMMLENQKKQEEALIKMLKIRINNSENNAVSSNEELEFLVKFTKHAYKDIVMKIKTIQKQLITELADLKSQSEENYKYKLNSIAYEQDRLKKEINKIKQQANTMLLFTKYRASLTESKKSSDTELQQAVLTPRLTC